MNTTNTIANQIIELLSQNVGHYVASLQVRAACSLANLDMEKLEESHLPPLSDRLELLYETKFGREIARSIKQKVVSLPNFEIKEELHRI